MTENKQGKILMVKGKINRKSQKFNITFFSAIFENSTEFNDRK